MSRRSDYYTSEYGNQFFGESYRERRANARHLRRVKEQRRCFVIALGFLMIFLAVGGTSIKVGSIVWQYCAARKLYDLAADEYVKEAKNDIKKDKVGVIEIVKLSGNDSKDVPEWAKYVSVDAKSMNLEFPEAVGWLYFEDGTISYPIMHSGNNDKYMRTAYNGKKSVGGAIFMDGADRRDFSDGHMLIYGHNMKDRSMFGNLRKYRKEEYCLEHMYFQVITPSGKDRYQIFSANTIGENENVYTVLREQDPNLSTFVNREILLGKKPIFDVNISSSDQIMSLVTCCEPGYRFVVSAVKVDHIDDNNMTASAASAKVAVK